MSFDPTEKNEDPAQVAAWQSLPIVQKRVKQINDLARVLHWKPDAQGMTEALQMWIMLDETGETVPDIPEAVCRGLI